MLVSLLACETSDDVATDDVAASPVEAVGAVALPPPGDTGDTGDEPVYRDASELFGLTRVHTVDIQLDADAWDALYTSSYDDLYSGEGIEVPGRVTVDGETLAADVGVSVKGRWGSGRTLDEKAAFKLDLDQFDGKQRYLGLKALTLNNMVDDPSYSHEVLAYTVFAQAGVHTLRTGYAWVTVNGTDFGLYLNVETPDDEWLERVYAEPSGNLYDSDYIIWPDDSWTTIDFDYESQDYFDLEEGTDVGHDDVHAVTDAIQGTRGTAAFSDTVGALVDWNEFLAYWSAEAWTGHWDGYNYNKNNYRVYFDPMSGRRAHILPWGLDWTFTADPDYNAPVSSLGGGCLEDATCHAALRASVADLCAKIDPAALEALLDETDALVEPYVVDDPRREVDMATVRAYQDFTRSWIEGRNDFLLSW